VQPCVGVVGRQEVVDGKREIERPLTGRQLRLRLGLRLRLLRLGQRAPFGALVWRDVTVSEGGARAEAAFEGPAGERAIVWLGETAGKPAGGYRVEAGEATPALVEGLRAIMDALRARPAMLGDTPKPPAKLGDTPKPPGPTLMTALSGARDLGRRP